MWSLLQTEGLMEEDQLESMCHRLGTLVSMETERRGLVELYEPVSVLLWPAANKS
jgi:hypothetical protein